VAVELGALAPSPVLLVLAFAADLALGDPVYRWHPVRLMGGTIARVEAALRWAGLSGYLGGILLAVAASAGWMIVMSVAVLAAGAVAPLAAFALHALVLYSLLALGDLIRHVRRVDAAASAANLDRARAALGNLVGRDTAALDAAGCRRAAIESLAESLTDGFTSAVFWYVVAGIPGLAVFKVVSTLDSMVGYKTPRYLRFGWCGARADDVMNVVPARLSWLLVSAAAAFIPGCSSRDALRVGWHQHALVPGPNAGWSEAAAAGAIRRRLAGPIWNNGTLVTDVWIGDPADPPAGTADDVRRAIALVVAASLAATTIAVMALTLAWS
jgi:adenosylcobinamide-phosphate synthase